jgi:NADH-quinone oxidoreductase subunit J
MSVHLILFLAFGAVAVGGAINLLAQTHPINSALSLIAVMAALAGEYLLLGAEFLAAVQVIVYAGAVMVLFVFVIMLLNAGEEDTSPSSRFSRAATIAGFPGAAAILCLLTFVFLSERDHLGGSPIGGYLTGAVNNIEVLSHTLFTSLLLPFEVTSILILVAILGAVVLARKEQ